VGPSLFVGLHYQWRERRDLYPEGVASGDPESESVLLWTRRAPVSGETAATQVLTAEISEDESFRDVIALLTRQFRRLPTGLAAFWPAG
jgi:phosphodiesterase/alkaline phosphatase D-like protein